MKKIVTMATCLSLATLVSMSPTVATPSAGAASPVQAVKGFFEGEKANDIDNMVLFAKDTRFDNVNDQRDFYQKSNTTYPLVSCHITKVEKVDASHNVITVSSTTKNTVLPTITIAYNVEKQSDGTWKIVIQNVEFDGQKSSPTFGQILHDHDGQKLQYGHSSSTDGAIHPNVAVSYWNLSEYNSNGLPPNIGKFYTDGFSQSRTDGKYVINGWQDWYDNAGGFTAHKLGESIVL